MASFVLTAQLQLQAPNNVAQVVSQIQSQLNNVNVNVNVQGSAKAQAQIQQVTQSTNAATSAADRMGQAFAVSIRRFAAFSIATRAVGLFTSTLSDAISNAINFERQLIKVSQVTGKSVGNLRELTDEITRLATGLGVSSGSLLEVTTVLTQAGLTANDTKIALNSLAKAALAPNFDSITQTAEGAIAILAQFKQGVGALEGQLGSINAVAGAFAVEASDLIDVIRRSGGVFKSSGGSLNELLALFTSVRATTRESAESIGTGLRTIFTRIQRPETIEFLKQFGVELLDLEGKFVGPYEAMRRLSTAMAGLGERDITFIKVAEELGGFRQIGKVLPLLQQFGLSEAALNVAMKANNSLSEDAASAQAALAVRIMKVKQEFLALVRGMTESSTFQHMANTALLLASSLIKIADAIKPLLPLLAAVMAFKMLRGFGSFVGSVGTGLKSGRTFNRGGEVHRFAVGGFVPGQGGGDTVPAMLTPGEFVIRRSSAQSIGYGRLNHMNKVGKYANGGVVQHFATGSSGTGVKSGGGGVDRIVNLLKLNTKAGILVVVMEKVDDIMNKLTGGMTRLTHSTRYLSGYNDTALQEGKKLLAAIQANSTTLRRSDKAHNNLIVTAVKYTNSLFDSGASRDQVDLKVKQLITALDLETATHVAQAKATQAATSATSTAAASTAAASTATASKVVVPPVAASKVVVPPVAASKVVVPPVVAQSQQGAAATSKTATEATGKFGMGLSIVAASLQSILPPLNETSSATTKFAHSALMMATTLGGVIFALESFGVSLTKAQVMSFLGGGGIKGAGTAVRGAAIRGARGLQAAGMPTFAKGLFSLSKPLGDVAFNFTKLLGPLAIAGASIALLNAGMSAFYDASIKKAKAIETGDVVGAGAAASQQSSLESSNTGRMALGLGGAALGFAVGGPIGAAIGAGLGVILATVDEQMSADIAILFGGNTLSSAKALAEAQAQATKTQKAFEQSEKDAAIAMDDFNKGTISAADALNKLQPGNTELENLKESNLKANATNSENKGGMLRDVFTVNGLLGENSTTRNARIDTENSGRQKESNKSQTAFFNTNKPLMNEQIRSSILSGKSKEETLSSLGAFSPEKLRAQAAEAETQATAATAAGKTSEAADLRVTEKLLTDQAIELEKSFVNLDREIKAAKAKFEAINLGFRSVTSASDAASMRIDNFSKSFEVGASPIQQSLSLLESSLTSAGQNISEADFGAALSNMSDAFTNMGASADQVKKFTDSMKGIAGVQRNFPAIFDQMKTKIKAGGFTGMDANAAGKEFQNLVKEQLTLEGIAPEIQEKIVAAMGEVKLDDKALDAIMSGDYSALEGLLGDAGEEVKRVMNNIAQTMGKANQLLIDVTKQRIEAERNLLEAQKEALTLALEGRELQSKYGGRVLTNAERKQNILDKANTNGAGLSNMGTGSLADLQKRNAEIAAGSQAIEGKKQTKGGIAGVQGVTDEAKQQDLDKAYKDQISTIRELVKLEEENLKLISEKNKIEKEAIDALVTGDIDKFMQHQATVGATAAISTGNKSLMGSFGPEALGLAAQDIKRQQDAGVQSIHGVQLAGAGGLTQQGYGAALSARGVTDPRAAQIGAGTTAEEEASKSRLRDYGTALGETGRLGESMAEMKVGTANIKIAAAQLVVDKLATGGAPAIAKSGGGLIYANRGMFVPRGSDTVPAMLTPGEFVVRREAVNNSNNLQLLQAMNSGGGGSVSSNSTVMGFAKGGRVQYYSSGSSSPVSSSEGNLINSDAFSKLASTLNTMVAYVKDVAETVKSLPTSIKHQIGDTNVKVDHFGLADIGEKIKSEIMSKVSETMKGSYPTTMGLASTGSVLGPS